MNRFLTLTSIAASFSLVAGAVLAAGEPCYYEILAAGSKGSVSTFQADFEKSANYKNWGCEGPFADIENVKDDERSRGQFSVRGNSVFSLLGHKREAAVAYRCNAIIEASVTANKLALDAGVTAYATLTLCCPSDCEKRDCAGGVQRCMKSSSQKNPVCPTKDRCAGSQC